MQLLEIYLHKIQKYINLKLLFIVFISIQTDVFFFISDIKFKSRTYMKSKKYQIYKHVNYIVSLN